MIFNAETHLLTKILHVAPGDEADVSADYHIKQDWNLQENYSDMGSFIRKLPRPPYKLHIFFSGSARAGPFRYSQVSGQKSKQWEKEVVAKYDTFMTEKGGGMTKGAATEAMHKLSELKLERKRAALEKARAKAKEAVAKKKARRTIALS